MKRVILSKKLKFRLESVDNEKIIFCYDERIDNYFALDAKYYDILLKLKDGVGKEELLESKCEADTNLLIKGLKHRRLLTEEEAQND